MSASPITSDPRLRRLVERLPEPLRRDLKKTCVLGGLMLALAVVLTVQFGRGGGSDGGDEAAAAAVPAPTAAAAAASATPAALAAPRATASREDRPSTATRVARWLESPAVPLDRNVFYLRLEDFQVTGAAHGESLAAERPAVPLAGESLFWDDLAQALSARADRRRQQQIWVDNLAAAAGRLEVDTTIMGPTPVAMVNRARVRAGDTVEAPINGGTGSVAFRIAAIEPRRIVVERDGLRFEVTLAGVARAIAAGE